MLKRLSAKCDGPHKHQQLVGGRAASAAFYPTKLIEQMLRGIRDTADAENRPADVEGDALLVQSVARAGKLQDCPPSIASRIRDQDLE